MPSYLDGKFVSANDLIDHMQDETKVLIDWAQADLEPARENNAKGDEAEAKERLIKLGAIYNLLEKSHKN